MLCKNIEGQDIEVEKFPSTIEDLTAFQRGDFIYIFLDYNLGVKSGAAAVSNAQKVAKNIYDNSPKNKRPVTVIMSSDPAVDDKKKEKFRQEASMLEGVFRFSAKRDLVNANKVSLLIRAYKEEFYSNHVLQDYIEALIKAAQQANEAFANEVMEMKIEDYEYMQNSVLQDQQQPLGDYLGWLYGTYWTNLLFKNEDLKKRQDEIDKIITKKAPMHHSLPSEKLSEIFMTALFEQGLNKLAAHPWEAVQNAAPHLPYLHLGDILTKAGSKEVFMVLNPQCDLERPEKKGDFSILLIPGHLESLSKIATPNDVKTEFFIFEASQYRIIWKLREFKTVEYKNFTKWQVDNQLDRNYRLRLPFALDVQQRFTSDMSRVGIPVSPPISSSLQVEVYYKEPDATINHSFIARSPEYAFVPVTRVSKNEVRLTLRFALDFKAALLDELQRLEELSEDAAQTNQLKKPIEKLKKFVIGFDDWFFEHRSFPLPAMSKHKQLADSDILGCITDSPNLNQLQYTFMINFTTKPIKAVEQEEADGVEAVSQGEVVLPVTANISLNQGQTKFETVSPATGENKESGQFNTIISKDVNESAVEKTLSIPRDQTLQKNDLDEISGDNAPCALNSPELSNLRDAQSGEENSGASLDKQALTEN